jgi:hypothetical protein
MHDSEWKRFPWIDEDELLLECSSSSGGPMGWYDKGWVLTRLGTIIRFEYKDDGYRTKVVRKVPSETVSMISALLTKAAVVDFEPAPIYAMDAGQEVIRGYLAGDCSTPAKDPVRHFNRDGASVPQVTLFISGNSNGKNPSSEAAAVVSIAEGLAPKGWRRPEQYDRLFDDISSHRFFVSTAPEPFARWSVSMGRFLSLFKRLRPW